MPKFEVTFDIERGWVTFEVEAKDEDEAVKKAEKEGKIIDWGYTLLGEVRAIEKLKEAI
jgi:phosphoserine aminotransferase